MYISCFMYYWMAKSPRLLCWYQVGRNHASHVHLLQCDSSETAMQCLNMRLFLHAGAQWRTKLCLFWKYFLLICTKLITQGENPDAVYLYPRWCEAASLLLGCEKLNCAGSFVRNSRLHQISWFYFSLFFLYILHMKGVWRTSHRPADESASPGKQTQAWLDSASGSCFS